MIGSLGYNSASAENKFRFTRFTGAGFSSNWSSSGSEGGRGRGSNSFLGKDLGGDLRRFNTALPI